jgi:hypothetical protein
VNNVAANMPGIGVNVILEGLDSKSKISLDELLFELEVEYIQGYELSHARPSICDRLEKKIYKKIYYALGWDFEP